MGHMHRTNGHIGRDVSDCVLFIKWKKTKRHLKISPEPDHAGALNLGLSVSRTEEITFYCLDYLVHGMFSQD